jgi:hypothetical protein
VQESARAQKSRTTRERELGRHSTHSNDNSSGRNALEGYLAGRVSETPTLPKLTVRGSSTGTISMFREIGLVSFIRMPLLVQDASPVQAIRLDINECVQPNGC